MNNKSVNPLIDPRATTSNLDYVDMLRGMAIIGVLLAHSAYGMSAAGLQQLPFHIERLLASGKHGVTLFFVVSAFALMRSISLRYDRESQPIQKYFLRRFFRIAPAYYVVLMLVFLFSGTGVPGYQNPAEEHLTWLNLFAHLTFVNGFFPYYSNSFLGVEWSVSTEFTFYLLLPILFLWISRSSSRGLEISRALFAYCGALVISWLMYFKGGYFQALGGGFASPVFGAWSYFFLATHLNAFLAGVIVWLLIRSEYKDLFNAEAPRLGYLGFAVLVIVAVLAANLESVSSESSFVVWISVIFWGVAAAALTLVLNIISPSSKGLFAPLSFIGRLSFSLYLVHFPIFTGLSKFKEAWVISPIPLVNFSLYLILAFASALAFALALHRFVELPGIKLGQKVIDRLTWSLAVKST